MGSSSEAQSSQQQVVKGGYKVQTATFKPLAIVYGTCRVAGTLIWDGEYTSQSQGNGGKGSGGGSAVTYYSESFLMAVAQGQILGMGRGWKSSGATEFLRSVAEADFTIVTGALGQAPLAYLVSNHPGQALGYSGIAYVFGKNVGMGTSTQPGQYNWEVFGLFVIDQNGTPDANPRDIITDLLTNTQYGVGFPGIYGVGSGAAWAAYANYCLANNLLLSMTVDRSQKISEILKQIMMLTNSDLRWNGPTLEVIPYGDQPASANGATFTPNLTPVYTFDDDDFIAGAGDDPIEVDIAAPASLYNQFAIEYLNRGTNYDPETLNVQLLDQVENYGIRRAPIIQAHEVGSPITAQLVAMTQLQRSVTVLRKYTFKVRWSFYLLSALDIVGIVDTNMGLGCGVANVAYIGSDGGGDFVTLNSPLVKVPNPGDPVADKTAQVNTSVVAGAPGETAALFDGSTGFVAGNTEFTDPQVFSIECWFKTTSPGFVAGFSDGPIDGYNTNDRSLFLDSTGKLNWGVWPGFYVQIASTASYMDGKWHHVVGTLGPDGMVLYVDGAQVASSPNTAAQVYNGQWYLGLGMPGWSVGNFLSGSLARFAYYTSALSAARVAAHFAATDDATYDAAVLADAPTSFLKLDEASGSTAADSSGKGNPGTYTGGVTLAEPGPLPNKSKIYLTSTVGMAVGDRLAVSAVPVRITGITEDADNWDLEIDAEDLGVNTPQLYPTQARGPGVGGNSGTTPSSINPPIIFEPTNPLATAAKGAQGEIWMALSGALANENWGGCEIFFSQDQENWQSLGKFQGPSIMGTLYAALPAGSADPDTADTLAVDLSESGGVLSSLSDTLADKHQNLAYVDGEFISFADVAAGPDDSQYACTYLRRHLYKTKNASHAEGSNFVYLGYAGNLGINVFRWLHPPSDLEGQTIYFQFCSFNTQTGEEESQADVPVYSYTVIGAARKSNKKNRASDSPLKKTKVYWPIESGFTLVTAAGPSGENAWVYFGTGGAAPAGTQAGTVKIPVIPGETVTLSGYIDATNVSSGSPRWAIMDPTLATVYCQAVQIAGMAGTVNASFTVPSGVTRVVLVADANGATVALGEGLICSSPQIEEGDEPTEYNENLNDELNTSGGSVMSDPTDFAASMTKKNDLKLTWQYPGTLPVDFQHFAVYVGPTFNGATLVHYTKKFELVITDPTPGTNTYWVAVFNDAGAIDPSPPSISVTVPAIGDVSSLAATISKKNDVKLTWTKPASLPSGFDSYEIRSGSSWAAGTLVDRTKKTVYLITDPSPGTNTYWVGVLDKAGNYDPTPPSVSITVSAPGDVSGLAATITNKNDVKLSWTKPSSLPSGFEAYEIRVGSSWSAATFVDRTKKSNYLITDPTPGTNTYWVGVLDLAGNYDASPPSVSITVPSPGDVSGLTATVTKKNDVQLKWTKPSSLPTGFEAYEIRQGSSWAAGTLVDRTKQAQYLITDPPAGSVSYWVGVLDKAGNYDASPQGVTGSISTGFSLDTVLDGSTYIRVASVGSDHLAQTASIEPGAINAVGRSNVTVPVSAGTGGNVQPSTAYKKGVILIPTVNNPGSYAFECVNGGTTASSPPTWPQTPGSTIAYGGSTWMNVNIPEAYSTWQTVASTTINVNNTSDEVEIVVKGDAAASSFAYGDEADIQILVNGVMLDSGYIMTGTAAASIHASGVLFHWKGSLGVSGNTTIAVQMQVVNGSGGSCMGALERVLLTAHDFKR